MSILRRACFLSASLYFVTVKPFCIEFQSVEEIAEQLGIHKIICLVINCFNKKWLVMSKI